MQLLGLTEQEKDLSYDLMKSFGDSMEEEPVTKSGITAYQHLLGRQFQTEQFAFANWSPPYQAEASMY
jgi:hypothetical protein